MSEYRIDLGVGLNQSQLNQVKQILNSIESQKREVVYNIDFKIINSNNLVQAGKEIDNIKAKIDALNSTGKVKGAVPIDTKNVEKSLNDIFESIKKLQNAFGKVDSKKGVQSLLTTVNKIRASLDGVSKQFGELNKNLGALSNKKLDFKLDFGLNDKNNPERMANEFKMLKREAEEYEKYFSKVFASRTRTGSDKQLSGIFSLVSEVDKSKSSQLQGLLSVVQSGGSVASPKTNAALREYVGLIQEVVRLSNGKYDLSIPQANLANDGSFVRMKNEINETEQQLKEMFSGGINAEKLHADLTKIVEELSKIQAVLDNVSKGVSIDKITESFREMSVVLETLTANAKLLQEALNAGGIGVNSGTAKATQAAQQTGKMISDSAQKAIDKVTSKGIKVPFAVGKIDSETFENEMNNIVQRFTKGKGSLVSYDIETKTTYDEKSKQNIEELAKAHVTYKNAVGESIKKTFEWQQIGAKTDDTPVMGWVESHAKYQQAVEKSKVQTDNFVKQQKRAVADLTNTAKQLNASATDSNANRPIKDKTHLDALEAQYKEITQAIAAMGGASKEQFEEERNRVKTLISDYKIMKAQFQNAENVAMKMAGADYQSGRKIAGEDLAKLEAEAKQYASMSATIAELKKKLASVGDSAKLKEFNNELRVARAELAKVKAEANANNLDAVLKSKSFTLGNSISDLQNANKALVNFKVQIGAAEVSVESLLNDLAAVKTSGDFNAVNAQFKAFEEAARNAGVIVNDVVVKASEINKIKSKLTDAGFDGFAQEVNRAGIAIAQLNYSSETLDTALLAVKAALEKIKEANAEQDIQAMVAANKEYEESLRRVYSLINLEEYNRNITLDSNALDLNKTKQLTRLEGLFESGSAAAKKYGEKLKELRAEINACTNGAELKNAATKVDIFEKTVKNSGLNTKTFGTQIKDQFRRYSQYLSVHSMIMYATNAMKDMFQQVKLIDSAMTELKKVTDESDASYNKFLSNAASKAKELGTTVDGLISSTADFARLGYGFEDSQKLAEVANIYAVVGDEIEGVEDATQSLVSTLAAFKSEMNNISDSDFAMGIVDKMNEVSNNFAISSGGIGQALQRSASSMAAANNSLDETIALITAANTVAQNPEKVGNAFKTMSMRIRGAKTELEEAGESTEGMASSTASLRAEIKALSGVDIMLDANTFKSTYQIMDELADKWENLSDIAQATIIELVAGKHQGNVFSSLMANFDIAEDALATSIGSAGSAMEEHAKWSESLEARLNKLKATWQSLSQSFLNSDFLKVTIDLVTDLVNVLDKLISAFGSFGTIGIGLGINGIVKNFETLKTLPKSFATGSKKIMSSLSGITGAIGIAVSAISLAYNWIKKTKEEEEKLRQETIAASDSFLDAADSFEQAYIKYSGKNNLTAEEESELESAIKGTVDALNDKSSALHGVVNSSNDYVKSLESIAKAEREAAKNAAEEKRDAAKESLQELVTGWTKLDGSEVDVNLVVDATGGKSAANDKTLAIAKEIGGNFYNTDTYGSSGIKHSFAINPDAGMDEIVNYYYMLKEYLEALKEEELKNTDAYKKTENAIKKMAGAVDVYTSGVYEAAKANYEFEKGIPTTVDEYLEMREAILNNDGIVGLSANTKQLIAGELDKQYGKSFDLTSSYVQARKFVGIIKDYDGEEVQTTEAFLNIRTAVNNNECTVGEYMSQFDKINEMTKDWDEESKKEFEKSFGIDTDSIKQQYDDIVEHYMRNFDESSGNTSGIQSAFEGFLDKLSVYELTAMSNLDKKAKIDWKNTSWENILKQIEKEARLIEAESFSISLDVEKESLDNLTTAVTEALSGSGLSTQSTSVVESMFKNLDSYDKSKLFERTANGIRLNTEELRKLEDEYKKKNIDGLDKKIDALGERYYQTREELSDLTYGTDEYNKKARDLRNIEDQINAAEKLSAQYRGLASSYQSWQRAEAAGSQRDMYESMIEGFENVDDEISRGWLDDGTIEFLRLIKGNTLSAVATTQELKDAYNSLDDAIAGTTYSVRDFFTVDEDGNSTNTGVYNFLRAVHQLEKSEQFKNIEGIKDLVTIKDGKVTAFNFDLVGGDEVIAEALGVSEELVQIMVRAADDAGFVVSMDGTFQQLDILKEKAKEAAKALKDNLQITDRDFFVDGSNEGIMADYEAALGVWNTFKANKNADGTINMNIEGAEEAFTVVSTLQSMVDKLGEPAYMEIDTSQVEKEMQVPLSQLQEYETLVQTENQLKLKGTDTTEIDKAQDKILDYFEKLDPQVKAKLGIDNNSREEIQRKLEAGEIEIPAKLDLQVEMNNTLRDMVNIALYNAGLLGDGEDGKTELKRRVDVSLYADKVDTSDVKEQVQAAESEVVEDDHGNKREVEIEVIAETFGVENVEELSSKLDGVKDKDVHAVAEAIGTGDIDNLHLAIDGLDDKTVEAIAEALGKDGVDGLKSSIDALKDKTITLTTITKTVVEGAKTAVSNGAAAGKKVLQNRSMTSRSKGLSVSNVDGTTGRAFGQGSWGTKNSGTALVGELGRETLVRDGKYYTIGDYGAEFIKYQRGDIIFNHKQTEELFRNGRVTSGGGRAKALANGTAFAQGTAFSEGKDPLGEYVVGRNSSTGKSYTKSKESDNFEETIDWVEIAISRIEREISNLDKTVDNAYKSWAERNESLSKEIGKVTDEIDLQKRAYNEYMSAAKGTGLSESYARKVRDGTIDIQTIKDEAVAQKVKDYQEWYEKALKCEDTIEDLKKTEAELYAQRVEYAGKQFDGILGVIEHEKNMLDEYISQSEANGYLVSDQHYNALKTNEQSNLDKLNEQKNAMLAELQTAMASGKIKQGSEAWYDMVASIDDVTRAIAESDTQLLEYDKNIRELHWEQFDLLQERISNVAEEAEFLIELLSNDKLYDDNGKMTGKGLSKMGLHGQNYNTYMNQADRYYQEVYGEGGLQSQVDADPYNQDLINRRDEMLEQQREMILAAEGEKEAIRDMVEEGINLELDALQERIDKYNESIDAAKDLYDYQKRVKEQSEEIASLEKQLTAYGGDTSEEAMAKKQELEVALKSAREELQETEHDRYIAEQEKLLDELYTDYEEILNARLDNIDALMSDMITEINTNASTISTTISTEAQSVGYKLSESMDTIWNKNTVDTNNVLTTYGEGFIQAQTTTNNALSTININLQNMITALNKMAGTKIKSASMSSAANSEQAKTPEPKPQAPQAPQSQQPAANTIKVGGKINAGSAQIYDYAGDKSGERQYFRNDPIYTVLAEKNGYLQVRWHKLSKGTTGWFKKGDVKALATGARRIESDDVAWTQEKGREFIVRPSDGAILTPVAKDDSVLNANASSNIWNMANAPAEFIKDNLKLSANSVPNNSNVQSNYTQHLDKVVFNLPNVKNYEELLSAMQKDKNFERLILSMSIDRLAGKSSLAKGKSIR